MGNKFKLIALWMLFSVSNAEATALQDLQAEIAKLKAEIALLKTGVSNEVAQDVQVVNAINVALSPKQSLTVGIVAGKTSIDLPVYFKASTQAVSGLQFDLVLSTGLTVTSITPGIAAQVAGKSTQGNPVQVGHRVLIFGVNQTIIPSGPVAIIKLSVGGNKGKLALPIMNLSGSSPTGTNVPLAGLTGGVNIQ